MRVTRQSAELDFRGRHIGGPASAVQDVSVIRHEIGQVATTGMAEMIGPVRAAWPTLASRACTWQRMNALATTLPYLSGW